MVARVLWEHDVAGSNPVIPTKKEEMTLVVISSFLMDSICVVLAIKASALALGERAKTVDNRFYDAKSAKQRVRFDGLCSSQMTTM